MASNPSWQLQAHFQISLELLCRRLGFQAPWCRGRQTRHLHPLDGNHPWCLLCPVPLRPWRLSSLLMQIDQVLLSLIHQLKPWLCLLTALGAAASRSEMGPLQMSHGSLVPSQSEQNCTSRAHSTVAIKTQKSCPSPLWDGPCQVLTQGCCRYALCSLNSGAGSGGRGKLTRGPSGLLGPSAGRCSPHPFLMAHS